MEFYNVKRSNNISPHYLGQYCGQWGGTHLSTDSCCLEVLNNDEVSGRSAQSTITHTQLQSTIE